MDTNRILDMGQRGIHLLFDRPTIREAFRQDADALRDAIDGRFAEVNFAIQHVLELPSLGEARRYVESLPSDVRHVLVLLYFELLDGRLKRRATRH